MEFDDFNSKGNMKDFQSNLALLKINLTFFQYFFLNFFQRCYFLVSLYIPLENIFFSVFREYRKRSGTYNGFMTVMKSFFLKNTFPKQNSARVIDDVQSLKMPQWSVKKVCYFHRKD